MQSRFHFASKAHPCLKTKERTLLSLTGYSTLSCAVAFSIPIVFSTVLPICFIFGVLLVGLGERILYPLEGDGTIPEAHWKF